MNNTVTLRYFAQLAEQRGCHTEQVELHSGQRAEDLYRQLQQRYRFSLNQEILRPAVNGVYTTWDQELQVGDEIAFIPPVAGG